MNRRTLLKSGAQAVAGSMLCSLIPLRAASLTAATGVADSSGISSAEFISTTQSAPWQRLPLRPEGWIADTLDVQVSAQPAGSPIAGFGACFNELGWTSLQPLSDADRAAVFAEIFSPGVGANFNLCRMPVGANDFARDWYSYDETPATSPSITSASPMTWRHSCRSSRARSGGIRSFACGPRRGARPHG